MAHKRDFNVAAVAEMPWAHNPYNCDHFPRWKALHDETEPWLDAKERERRASQALFTQLTKPEFAACHYHRMDWRRVCAIAVDALASDSWDDWYAVTGGKLPHLSDCENHALATLFRDPIRITGASISNGQHRICALRAQGVPRVVVNATSYFERATLV
jgi:hypothetical protein